ncbi:Signal transduction histidine-protein kinase BarA [Zhongshania aliphaticivorans]|uniref:histidine kinase n=1 Tax=Zhongshania aliphaticivorans TaxID=1470434 RepID=A0A5S9NC96_9GAMM|nr:ATP-binding protein [Zhongshania aliphaticivorans]CAA0086968.1 Signal transduction histidine-protein kinase BarA [Zhongshania aliphaticivorans]CAA0113837.1 Signal transduction histidine-protein kinase BarA [Zhongshania aliphaticivorans]
MQGDKVQATSGLQLYACVEIDGAGVIVSSSVAHSPIQSELSALSEGGNIASVFPDLLLTIVGENLLTEEGMLSVPACLGSNELIVNVRSGSAELPRYTLNIFPDELGLSHLYRREKRFEFISHSLYESSLDAIITIDGESIIREFGKSAEKLFGYSREEAIGQNVAEIVIPPSLRQAHHDGMSHFHKTNIGPVINTRIEVNAVRRDGSEFPCELTVVSTDPYEGEVFFTATIRDISERKAKEKALESARKIAEASNLAKSSFLAHMSHEIRSPLNAVIGCLDLLLDSAQNDEQRTLMQTSLSAGQGLLGIIEDILDFSKIEAGQLNVNIEEFNLLELCEQLLEVITIRTTSKDLDISMSFDSTIPATIASDQGFIRRILTNLLDNAVKFTEKGGVSLWVCCRDNDPSSQHIDLLFEVRDTGIGIPKASQSKLFKEFSQVDSSDSTEYGGTGLGLAICRELAEQLNGHITVESDVGQGCLFRAIIPVDVNTQNEPALKAGRESWRTLIVCTDNQSLQATIKQQARCLGLSTLILSSLDELSAGMSADLSRDAFLFVDIANLASLEDSLNVLLQYGLTNEQTLLYGRHLSTTDLLHIGQAGYQQLLNRPFRPSIFVNHLNNSSQRENTMMSAPHVKRDGENYKILLAEDNSANQLVAKTMLNRAGYELDIVSNGEEAVFAVKNGKYGLVLMDLRMPILDGLQATQIIRESDLASANIPIIAMTANAFDSDRERCKEAGMNDFLAKPVNRDELLRCMARWLGAEGDAEASSTASANSEAPVTGLNISIVNQLLNDTSEDAVKMIMQMVVDELNKLRDEIEGLDSENINYVQLRELAHASKGSCGYCGVTVVQQFCEKLEIAAGLKDDAELDALLNEADSVISSGLKALNDFITSLG